MDIGEPQGRHLYSLNYVSLHQSPQWKEVLEFSGLSLILFLCALPPLILIKQSGAQYDWNVQQTEWFYNDH